jgi:hypothetical protein
MSGGHVAQRHLTRAPAVRTAGASPAARFSLSLRARTVSGAIHFCSLNLQVSIINSREWIADGQRLLPTGAGPFTRRLGREALFPLLERFECGPTL